MLRFPRFAGCRLIVVPCCVAASALILAGALSSSPAARGDEAGGESSLLDGRLPAAAVSFFPPREVGGWKSLFDGESIDNTWKVRGGFATYKAEDGAIVGTTSEGSPNTFLCKGPFADFELVFEVNCDKELNSGVQIRSHVAEKDMPNPSGKGTIKKGTVFGYQCEIAPGTETSGNFWDEARHGKWWDDFANKPEARKAFKVGEWNKYRIVAQGDHIRSWINDVACADFHDQTDASGVIGLQVHGIKKGTGPYHVRWKNIRLRDLKPGEKVE